MEPPSSQLGLPPIWPPYEMMELRSLAHCVSPIDMKILMQSDEDAKSRSRLSEDHRMFDYRELEIVAHQKQLA